MANLCPLCGLPSSTLATGGHDVESVIPGGCFITGLPDACVFSDPEGAVPIIVVTRPDRLTHDDQLHELTCDDFLIPGLPEDRAVVGEAVLIRFRGTGRMLPLPALLMGSRPPAAELVWSWFREAFSGLSRLHSRGVVHGRLDENLFLLLTHEGPGPSVGQRLLLLVPTLSAPSDPARLPQAMETDLQMLCEIFSRLLSEVAWQRGLDEFRHLLQLLSDAPSTHLDSLAREITSCQRMSQLEAPQEAPVRRKIPWKKPALVFLVLFFGSLVATKLFSGGSGKPKAKDPDSPLLKPPDVVEPVVERTSLRWDREFPLHRMALDDQILLYLSPGRVPELAFILEAAGLLGFSIPAVARNPQVEAVIQLRLTGPGWRQRLTLSMTRTVPTATPETPTAGHTTPPSSPGTVSEPPRWQSHLGGARLKNPDAISPPPLLLGELGTLLVMAGYDPERVDRERLLLLISPPTELAPRHTVWQQILGGVRPSFVLLRLADTGELLVCVLSFERKADAQGAATFLRGLLDTTGIPERELVQQNDNRLLLRLNLGMLAERWRTSREPSPSPVQPDVDIPPPPIIPPEEPPSAPHRPTMEFLVIPEH